MATILIKLYNYHDDDLLQLRLNGLDLGFVFARALEACFYREKIRFVLPAPLVLDKTRRKNSRVRVTLNDKTQNDLCTWLEGFEPYYRNQAIKNIARMYLDGNGISCFNAFFQSGKWAPASSDDAKAITIPYLHKKKKAEDPEEWLDRIGKGQTKRGLTGKKKQEAIEKMRETPLNELLGKPEHVNRNMDSRNETASAIQSQRARAWMTDTEKNTQKHERDVPDYDIMQAEQTEAEERVPVLPEKPEEMLDTAKQQEHNAESTISHADEDIPEPAILQDNQDVENADNDGSSENDDADDSYDVFQIFENLKGN